MITMKFTNWSHAHTLANPITSPEGPTDHVIHSPGPTLPPGANDFLQVDQTLGEVLNLGELPLQAYTSDTTTDWFVVVASMPTRILGFNPFESAAWYYWIGPPSWTPPGETGWVTGTTATLSAIPWGSAYTVSVSPQMDSDILLDIAFHDA